MLRIKANISIVFIALLAACRGEKAPEPEPQNEVSVEVAPVAKSDIQLKVSADAILYPLEQAAIVPKLTAPVKKFYVQRGDRVKAGQLLAELENRDLASAAMESKAAADQAEAAYQTTARAGVPQELQKAELDVRAAKDALDAQQKIYDARQDLYKQGAIAQKDANEAQVNLTQARNQYEIAKKHLEDLQSFTKDQEIKSAAAQRDAAQARHETSQVQLAYSRIVSPIDGVVTDRPLFAGETPQSGAPLITVMDVSSVIARAHFALQEAAHLKVGNSANLIIPGMEPVPGKVTQISPALDPASTTVEVWIQAANPRGQLKPGSSVRVEAISKTVPDALVIPYAAVLTDTETGHTSVIVADKQNKPHKKEVSLGIREGDTVQVVEGLEDGERVVTAGAFELGKLEDDVLEKTTLKIAAAKEEPDEK
jgi:multidrug efflux pump subunit AcrA (membrane-fusion protein)